MKTTLELKDLFIGKIDAKNEPIDNENERYRFIDGFLLPDNVDISQFINGKRYYIVGLKGTGKTALLKYIQLQIEEQLLDKVVSRFILFKSDFTEEDKSSFSRASQCLIPQQTDEIKDDFTEVWLWYIHRQIVNIIIENKLENRIFIDDDNWERYKSCVLAPKLGNEKAGIMRLIPKIKRGNIEITGDFAAIKGKLGLDFEWIDDSKTKVKFSDIVKQANTLYETLQSVKHPNSLYIFFDELELSFNKTKQHNTDMRLIRDVIVAINKLNSISIKRQFPIHTITSIRSEVLTAIEVSGKEINKVISDFGVTLKWPQKGDDSKNHPLMNIITKKIASSYRMYSIEAPSEDDIWQKFFPQKVGEKSIYEFLLNKTWYRPRDIIRLLSIAQNQFPNEISFTQKVLDIINKEYSIECWKEQVEELRAIYNEEEMTGIKKILLGIQCPFSFFEIDNIAAQRRKIYNDVDKLLLKYKIGDILCSLFRIGVIGNTGQKMRYSFRGDDELIIDNNMTIHPALWNFLAIERRVCI